MPPPVCGASLKRGRGTCRQPAGSRTDHPGQGRCWLHGGRSGTLKHGRYSLIQRPRIQQLLGAIGDDPRPRDTLPEVQLVRALLVDFIERYDAWAEALLAWHASWRARNGGATPAQEEALRRIVERYEALRADEEGEELGGAEAEDLALARAAIAAMAAPDTAKPAKVLDLADAYQMAAEVTRMVERIDKREAEHAVSLADVERLLFEFKRVMQAHVHDAETVRKIEEGWLAVRL